jgi:phage baseplate assembly protein W
MARTQKYGIEFPVNIKNGKYLLDLNKTLADSVKSQMVHLIFTPMGQRLRNPEFGTNLIQYLFNPDDKYTWDDVVMHVKDKVNKYIKGCEVENVVAERVEDNHISVKVNYTVFERDGEKHRYQLEHII